jgi:hypothetical protein
VSSGALTWLAVAAGVVGLLVVVAYFFTGD